ncbi:hypothetical protein IID21_04715 [Patescibacteria group bacterium]|nr:hypothetical protein [Patescibacteria group bacterium]
MSEDGLEVDLDDLGWEANRAYASFLDQDPEKLRLLAVKGLEFGMFDEEESQEMLADADYVEEEQKRLQRSI